MLAVTNVDVFALMNELMQRYPPKKQPTLYFGISSYFATSTKKEHAIVLDAAMRFRSIHPSPIYIVKDDIINWEEVDKYLDTPVRKLPDYVTKRMDIIDSLLSEAAKNDKHALSAMLSNFTPLARPQVRVKVIEFLKDPSVKTFELPEALRPKRGRAVDYYTTAIETDFSGLKQDILLDVPLTYEGRYWRAIIMGKPKKGSKP